MATKTLLTLEQFEQLPDDGMRHELDEGELISMPPTVGLHGRVVVEMVFLLRNFVGNRKLGVVLADSGFRLSEATVRAPDVSFIRADRSAQMDFKTRFQGAPDLAVEVISPSDRAEQIGRKVNQYLNSGAIVWVVYPNARAIHVFEPSQNARVLKADDLLECPTLLPGFSVRVADIFS